MALHEYKIGTSVEALTYVEQLVLGSVPPNLEAPPPGGATVRPFAFFREAVSGLEYGDGYPETEWAFSVCRQSLYDALMAYIGAGNQSASVYIQTRKDDTSFAVYTAVMHRPKIGDEGIFDLGFWRDLKIRFTMLEEVV